MATGISEYCAGFKYREDERGITATRIFHYDPDSTVDNDIEVPSVGDWLVFPLTIGTPLAVQVPTDLSNVLCRTRDSESLAGHPSKIQWICTYNNEPVDKRIFTKPGDEEEPTAINKLPMSLEYSGEYITINPEVADGWVWQTSGDPVKQPIAKRVNLITLRIVRYVSGLNYQNFQRTVRILAGTVNDKINPFLIGSDTVDDRGSWLFINAPTENFYNNLDKQWYRVELEFQYRVPYYDIALTNPERNGWQKLLKLDGTWDIVVDNMGNYRYAEGDFSALFDDSIILI